MEGEFVADKFSRGGVVTYNGSAKCAWRRRMTKDGKCFIRLIMHKGKVVLQKAQIEGAPDGPEGEDGEPAPPNPDGSDCDSDAEGEEAAPAPAPPKKPEPKEKAKKKAADEAPADGAPPAKRVRRPAKK